MGYKVDTIASQIGRGLNGGLAYVGAHGLAGKEIAGGECDSHVDDRGFVIFDTGLMFKVNGKRGSTWKMIVTLEGSDTYTVRLMKVFSVKKFAKTGKIAQVLDEATDVYCDQLQDVIEGIYDKAIRDLCDGWIRI